MIPPTVKLSSLSSEARTRLSAITRLTAGHDLDDLIRHSSETDVQKLVDLILAFARTIV
jgi:hypothetical protein